MKKIKRMLVLALSLAMLLTMVACNSGPSPSASLSPSNSVSSSTAPSNGSSASNNDPDPRVYNIATGALGAYNYTLYAGVSDLISKEFPGKYTISLIPATGSTEMARLIMIGDADFGTCSLDDMIDAYNGVNDFEGLPSGRLRFLYNTGGSGPTCHLFTATDSSINSVQDLEGKKIGVTAGYMVKYMNILFEIAGLDANKIDVSLLSISDICNGIQDETLDAGFYSSPHPLTNLTDLSVTSGMRLINIGDELVDKIIEAYPFMHKVVIPGGTYQGNDEDIVTYTAYTCWVCGDDVPEQTVYDWLTVILADSERLGTIHPNAAAIKLETALEDRNIPLHPGALRYYQDKGMITTDELADLKPTN